VFCYRNLVHLLFLGINRLTETKRGKWLYNRQLCVLFCSLLTVLLSVVSWKWRCWQGYISNDESTGEAFQCNNSWRLSALCRIVVTCTVTYLCHSQKSVVATF